MTSHSRTPVDDFIARSTQDTEDDRVAYLRALRRDPCSYCDAPEGSTQLDHIGPEPLDRSRHSRGPLSRLKAHDPANATAACARCNRAKRRATLLLFLLEQVDPESPAPGSVRYLDLVSRPPDDATVPDLLRAIAEIAETSGSRARIAELAREALKRVGKLGS